MNHKQSFCEILVLNDSIIVDNKLLKLITGLLLNGPVLTTFHPWPLYCSEGKHKILLFFLRHGILGGRGPERTRYFACHTGKCLKGVHTKHQLHLLLYQKKRGNYLVVMTITWVWLSHTILQKSTNVFGKGPVRRTEIRNKDKTTLICDKIVQNKITINTYEHELQKKMFRFVKAKTYVKTVSQNETKY